MKKLFPVIVLSSCAVLASCSLFQGGSESSSGGTGSDGSDVQALISKAESAYKELDAIGGAWSFMDDDLQEAKTAASKQEVDKAMKLAKKVMFDVEVALKQANDQKNASPHLF